MNYPSHDNIFVPNAKADPSLIVGFSRGPYHERWIPFLARMAGNVLRISTFRKPVKYVPPVFPVNRYAEIGPYNPCKIYRYTDDQ